MLAGSTSVVLYLSLSSSPPSDGLGWDKANHAFAMSAITLLAFQSARPAGWAAAFGGVYALALGVLIELLQWACTSNRRAEWGDLVADGIGIALVVAFLLLWQRRKVAQ